jgi:hypothetical protein
MQLKRTASEVELYFPPGRTPGVAFALGVFGVIAAALPAIAIARFFPAALADARGLMGAALLASFVVPFTLFGAACVVLALSAACNSLLVRVDEHGITTRRMLFGITIRRRVLERDEIASIVPHMPARHQSAFDPDPIYQLVALNRRFRTRRLVVAESLRGEEQMKQVKAQIEEVAGVRKPAKG